MRHFRAWILSFRSLPSVVPFNCAVRSFGRGGRIHTLRCMRHPPKNSVDGSFPRVGQTLIFMYASLSGPDFIIPIASQRHSHQLRCSDPQPRGSHTYTAMYAPPAGNPHATRDVAGAGNGAAVVSARHRASSRPYQGQHCWAPDASKLIPRASFLLRRIHPEWKCG